jgi:hypothetical protein
MGALPTQHHRGYGAMAARAPRGLSPKVQDESARAAATVTLAFASRLLPTPGRDAQRRRAPCPRVPPPQRLPAEDARSPRGLR